MKSKQLKKEQTMTSTITTYYRPAQPKVRNPPVHAVLPFEERTLHDPEVSHKCPVKNPRSIVRVQRRDGCVYETAAVNVGWGPKGTKQFPRPGYEIIGYTETGRVALSMEAMSRAQAKS